MIFRNLRVVSARRVWECDIEVEEGRIRRIGRQIPGKGVDVKGKFALFNTVDMHTHMRDWEQKEKEIVETGTKAALAGGITTIVDMPNTTPCVQDLETYTKRYSLFSEKSICDWRINLGARTTGNILPVFKKYTPPFIKIYMSHTTGNHLFRGSLERLFSFGKSIALHGEIKHMRVFSSLSKKYGTPLHVSHVSSRKEIGFLAKCKGKNMTLEVTPHHLLLENLGDVRPPVGSYKDREALWANMKNIDVVASDHAPHTQEDKENGALGYSGTEILLPLMLDCVNKKMLSLFDLEEKISGNPCRLLAKKSFGVGADASFTLVDVKKEWKIDASRFFSKGKNTPFDGRRIRGAVSKTYMWGEEVFDGDNVFICSRQGQK